MPPQRLFSDRSISSASHSVTSSAHHRLKLPACLISGCGKGFSSRVMRRKIVRDEQRKRWHRSLVDKYSLTMIIPPLVFMADNISPVIRFKNNRIQRISGR